MLISSDIAIHSKGIRITREADFGHWTCGYLYRGTIRMKTPKQMLDIASESFIIIPPLCPYEFDVIVPDEHIWAIFDTPVRFPPSLRAASTRIVVYKLNPTESMDAALIDSMKRMLMWWQLDPMRSILAENALEQALLLTAELEQGKERGLDSRVAKALSYIAQGPSEIPSIADLSEHVGLSPSRFAALFREETGQTPARYMEVRRLELACERLLNSSLTIAEVAESVGYKNAFHFSTRFRAVFEQSPRDFRQSPKRLRHKITPEDRRGR